MKLFKEIESTVGELWNQYGDKAMTVVNDCEAFVNNYDDPQIELPTVHQLEHTVAGSLAFIYGSDVGEVLKSQLFKDSKPLFEHAIMKLFTQRELNEAQQKINTESANLRASRLMIVADEKAANESMNEASREYGRPHRIGNYLFIKGEVPRGWVLAPEAGTNITVFQDSHKELYEFYKLKGKETL
jgi:hypothetical protein